MDNFETEYGDATPYKSYLQDGERHYMTDLESSTAYWHAFYGAFGDRFPERNFNYELLDIVGSNEIITPEEEIPEVVVEEPEEFEFEEEPVEIEEQLPEEDEWVCECYKKDKTKNIIAIATGFTASILAIVLAFISFFKIGNKFIGGSSTEFFSGIRTSSIIDLFVNAFKNNATSPYMYGMLACFVVAFGFTVAYIVVSRLAMTAKNKVNGLGVIGAGALIFAIGALVFNALLSNVSSFKDVLAFLNPADYKVGAQFGFYIGMLLAVVETVCGFLSYSNKD